MTRDFGNKLLRQVFPFHFVVDHEMRIVEVGQALARVASIERGVSFGERLVLRRPELSADFETLRERSSLLCIVGSKKVDGLVLRGQFIADDARERLVFVGSPWVTDVDRLVDLGLNFSDFGLHDSIVDLLTFMQASRQSNQEIRALVTELERRETDLRAANGRYEQHASQLERMVLELGAAKREAEKATAAKTAFLAAMSHELRTPMNAVIGMTQLLLETELSTTQRDYLSVVRASGDALLSVINDVLDFSRLESDRVELENVPFNLLDVVESSIDFVAKDAAAKGLDVALIIEDDVPNHTTGDPARVRQVLVNLLSNAVKFTHKGEVALHVDAHPRGNGEVAVVFEVRDTGIGIPLDRQGRMFEAFTQADASTSRRYGGSGLGLAICQRLARNMNGAVSFRSTPGVGSTFRFELRVVAGSASGAFMAAHGAHVCIRVRSRLQRVAITSIAERLGYSCSYDDDVQGASLVIGDGPEPPGLAVPWVSLVPLGGRQEGAETIEMPVKRSTLARAVALATGAVSVRPSVPAPPPVAHSLRILVAEDNPVNQEVVRVMLHRLGYSPRIVSNGLEAVAAATAETFDLVLMDVRMPDCDGLEATRRIRAARGREARIVALTASALEADKRMCLEAGMDAHLTKPISLPELAAVVREVRAPTPDPLAGNGKRAIDRKQLERIGISGRALTRIVATYLEDAPRKLAQLRDAAGLEDHERTARLAHALAGSSANLGALHLAELLRTMEASAESGTPVHASLVMVEEAFQRAAADLRIVSSADT